MHDILIQLLIFLAAAVIAVPLFKAFRLGPILAYLFAGVIIGPSVLRLIDDPKTVMQFSELGVVFLLFLIGLELKPTLIWSMRRQIFGMGTAQVIICGLLIAAVSSLLGYSPEISLLVGFGLALSSTAFALQLLNDQRQLKTLHGQSSFAILLLQDLAVVPLLALVPLLAGASTGNISLFAVLKVVAIIALFVLITLHPIRIIFRWIAQSRINEIFTASALFVVIGSAVLMEHAGLSMGTGAFLAGVLLANSEYRHELESDLEPFKGLLLGLFFIAVGMSLDLGVIAARPLQIIGIVAGFMTLKGLVIYGIGRFEKIPKESARNMAFTLPQGGEFAFVLFSVAVSAGVFNEEIGSVLAASVTISMAVSPMLFALNQKYLRKSSEISERPFDKIENDGAEVIVAGYGRFGQIVSRFLKSQNIKYTILEHSAGQIDVARRFGAKVFYGDASRKEIVASAGAAEAKIFVLAIDDVESSVATAKMLRDNFPHLRIVARVRNRQHAIDLMDLGIDQVFRETYFTSLEVAKRVLTDLGMQEAVAEKKSAYSGSMTRKFCSSRWL